MTLKRAISRIEKLDRKGDKLAQRAAAIQLERRQLQNESRNAKRNLAIDLISASGLLNQPVADIVAALKQIRPGAALADPVSADASDAAVECEAQKQSAHYAGSEKGLTIVRISKNAAADKLALLEASGFHWNGKYGYWHGHPDPDRLGELQAVFGDRLTPPGTEADTATADGGEAPAANTVPADAEAARLGEPTVGEQAAVVRDAQRGPERGIEPQGASKPRIPPVRPPLRVFGR